MSAAKPTKKYSGMKIPGLHLTQIGNDDFLLEPSRGLNIHDQKNLIEELVGRSQQAKVTHLYYDLAEQIIIDPLYFTWLNKLARALRTINVRMTCIHMQPTAALALTKFMHDAPAFETAINISGQRKKMAGNRTQHDQRRPN